MSERRRKYCAEKNEKSNRWIRVSCTNFRRDWTGLRAGFLGGNNRTRGHSVCPFPRHGGGGVGYSTFSKELLRRPFPTHSARLSLFLPGTKRVREGPGKKFMSNAAQTAEPENQSLTGSVCSPLGVRRLPSSIEHFSSPSNSLDTPSNDCDSFAIRCVPSIPETALENLPAIPLRARQQVVLHPMNWVNSESTGNEYYERSDG